MADSPSIISHISIGTNDFEKAITFYDQVLPLLGCRRLMEHPGVIAYGKQYPEFWINTPFDNKAATVGNGTHISFIAPTQEAVRAFYEAAIAAGAKDDGPPGGQRRVWCSLLRLLRSGFGWTQNRGRFLG